MIDVCFSFWNIYNVYFDTNNSSLGGYVLMISTKMCEKYSNGLISPEGSGSESPEELLLKMIFVKAVEDYEKCIKKGGIYTLTNIGTKSVQVLESCITIIDTIRRNPIFEYYDIDVIEYAFKEVDKKNGYWFNRWLGDCWVHPWDVVYNGIRIDDL